MTAVFPTAERLHWRDMLLPETCEQQGFTDTFGKRMLDVVGSCALLILLAPVFMLIGLAIKLDDRGPVFFTQERVGARRRTRDGRPVWEVQTFRMIKFRSMVQNADDSIHRSYIEAFVNGSVEPTQDEGPKFKLTKDPRITRVGRFLRRTSLDELPQLFNVLRGEMSLVGPRPVPIYEVAAYQNWHLERLAALPGITGLWQVKGRCEVSFEDMVRLDIEYVRKKSLVLDICLLAQTIPAVLSGRGAE